MRKYLALLLIILFVGLCGFIAFDEACLLVLRPDSVADWQTVIAIAADEWGNAYYISSRNGINTLCGVDDAGHIIVEKELTEIADAARYRVDKLYISGNKNIIVAAYEVEPDTNMAVSLSVHVFSEDGSYAVRALNRPLSMPLIECKQNTRVSDMSEDSANVYFALHQDGMTECFYMPKDIYEITKKSREFKSPATFMGFYAGTAGDVYFAVAPGQILVSSVNSSETILLSGASILVSRFYQGQGTLLNFRDNHTGGLYQLDTAGSANAYVLTAGTQEISIEDHVRVSDISFCYISRNGRLVCAMQDGSGIHAFYSGGTSYVTKIQLSANTADILNWLFVLGLAAGVLLLSILIWQVYCYVLKMRVSAIIRQMLLTALCVTAMLYALLTAIIRPSFESFSENRFADMLLSKARDMGSVVQILDDDTIAPIFEGIKAAGLMPGAIGHDIISPDGTLLFSTRGLLEGGLVSLELSHNGLALAINDLKGGEVSERVFSVHEAYGESMYAVVQMQDGNFISVSAGLESLRSELSAIEYRVLRFLIIAGGAILLLLTFVECFTVHNIHVLKKGVDAVSAGDYGAEIRVHSGNEIADLANSFNTMMKLVRSTIRNLNGANRALYRFVPESLVRLLGAGNVEELSRETHVQKNMTILYVRFYLESVAKTSEELFHDVNDVIGRLTPAVSQNEGTVYGFQYDGFQAVFSGPPEDALHAALQIRELTAALNTSRRKNGLCGVDVRLALGMGTVMLGVVGDENRMSPVAVSEAIRSASIMVETCRQSGIYIACTEPVFKQIEGYMYRKIGPMACEDKILEVYDFYDGDPYGLLKHKEMHAGMFDEARNAFYANDFEEARRLFMQIVKACPEDGVAKNYMYFADKFRLEHHGTLCYRLYE